MTLLNQFLFAKLKKIVILIFAILMIFSSVSAYGDDERCNPGSGPVPPDCPTSSANSNSDGLGAFRVIPYNCLIGCDNALLPAIQRFLIQLAPALAAIVIAWGGYKYFWGGIEGKSDGRQTIQAGVIGLAVVLLAGFIVDLISGGGDPSQALITADGFNTEQIDEFILSLTSLLTVLATAIAVVVIIWGGYQFLFSTLPGAKGDGKQTIINGVIGLIVIILASQIVEFVKSVTDTIEAGSAGDINSSALISFIVNITNFILIPVSAAVTVFFLVLGGYQYITARESYQVSNARKNLLNALIGFVVILLSVTIVQAIYYFVGTLSG